MLATRFGNDATAFFAAAGAPALREGKAIVFFTAASAAALAASALTASSSTSSPSLAVPPLAVVAVCR